MQTDAAGSLSAVTDNNSLHTALFSLGYSDSVDRQIQNHVMAPSTLGEAMINFSRAHMSSRVADELWTGISYHQTSTIQDMVGIGPPVENHEKVTFLPYPFESTKAMNSTFESTNYSFEGLPFDATFGRVVGNEWILTERDELNSNNPGPSRFSKELSLSLATSQPSVVHGTPSSEMSSSGVTSYSLHENTSCSSNSLSLNFNPDKQLQLSPFLSGSRFLHAMQEILAEIACYALENFDQMSVSVGRGCSKIGFSNGRGENNRFVFQNNLLHEREVESKKKHLLSLLQVVDDQYNRCLDEIHTVVSAFHAVTDLDPNLHARFALPTISLMYRNLRERISSHILAMGAHFSEGDAREDDTFQTSFIQKQLALQQLRKKDHQLWRPQRGLPERSVSVLRQWMFQNFLHPYPKDAEKHLLALKSGLTRSQVSNWFINARVRLWKPMIEEMYAEMNRRRARRNDEETNSGTLRNHMRFENRRFTMD